MVRTSLKPCVNNWQPKFVNKLLENKHKRAPNFDIGSPKTTELLGSNFKVKSRTFQVYCTSGHNVQFGPTFHLFQSGSHGRRTCEEFCQAQNVGNVGQTCHLDCSKSIK